MNHEFECTKCGECCTSDATIQLYKEDILKWIKLEKHHFVQNIQICPITISPRGLEMIDEGKREDLIQFILSNHTYHGEGLRFSIPIERPYLKKKWGSRPILTPKNFETILRGMEDLGLDYLVINELDSKCSFLKGKLCGIHEFKPLVCKNFPYGHENQIRSDKFALKICKVLKNLDT